MNNPMRMIKSGLFVIPVFCGWGCTMDNQGMSLFGGKQGEEWTILAARTQGPDRVSRAQRISRELKSCPELDPTKVKVHKDGRTCMVTYGSYIRKIEQGSRRRSISRTMRDDLQTIQLGIPRLRGRYAGASVIPMPFKNEGNPAMRLENGSGTWTLLIATFENTSGYYTRHEDAYALCKELRRMGYDAYYNHGKLISEVTVGSFGPDAVLEDEFQHGSTRLPTDPNYNTRRHRYSRHSVIDYSPEVRRLQKKEDFEFLLHNGRKQAHKGGYGKKYIASKLVRFRFEEEEDDYGFEEDLW